MTVVEFEDGTTGQLSGDFRRRKADSGPERNPTDCHPPERGTLMNSFPHFRPTVNAGDLVAISGQIGLADGRLVDGGAAEQTEQTLANLLTVLETAGLAASDVVKVNIYLTTMEDYAAFNERYNAFFGSEAPPARTCVAVHELPFGALVELEAWARRG